MSSEANANAKISMTVWATPAPGQTITDLLAALQEAGNPILMVDTAGGKVLIAKYDSPHTNEGSS